MAFIPPQGNKTVMVDNSNNIVYPAGFQKVVATQATIAGNNFTSVPSVIDPENATTTQLPSVASVVSYVSDVVEGGSSGLIPAIQSDIQSLGQVKSNRGEFWFNGGFARVPNMSMNGSWSLCCRIRMQTAQVRYASIFHFGAFYLYWNSRLGIHCSPAISSVNQISVDNNNRLANGEWHSLVVSYDGTTLKLTDETGVLLSVATSEAISISGNLLIGEANYNGQIADVKYFNFDMSDLNAPYTIADYISGKDESPLLNGGGDISLTTADSFTSTNSCTITESENGLTFTATTQYAGYASVKFPIVAGQEVEVSWEGELSYTGNHNPLLVIGSSAQALSYTSGYPIDIKNTSSPRIMTATKTGDYLGILLNSSSTSSAGDTAIIKGLKIKVNGALLSLDDYSIKVGATQIVPDVSSNSNDATITGAVYGSKDKSIAKMAQLFYQSQQG